MTGQELLTQACALMAETETDDYQELGLIYINMLLAETKKQNDRMRKHAGLDPMEGYPKIESLGNELPCQEELAREALPWGLAAKIFFDEDDNPRLSMFNEEFANRLAACDKLVAVVAERPKATWFDA